MSKDVTQADVETWKSKQLIEGVRGLGVSDEDCCKLEEEGIVNGRALIAMLRTGSLKEIISEPSVEVLQSKVLLSGPLVTELVAKNAEIEKKLAAFSFAGVWGVRSHSSSGRRTLEERLEFCQKVLQYYELPSEQCMVIGQKGPLTAAHIWPHSQSAHPWLQHLRLTEADINTGRNGLLLLTTIENAFDRRDLCFLYNPFSKKFYLKILNPALLEEEYALGHKFNTLEGNILNLPEGKFPFRRLLNTHARDSYRNALLVEWITRDTFNVFEDYAHLSDVATTGPVSSDDDFEIEV